jgi:hypothetical protein
MRHVSQALSIFDAVWNFGPVIHGWVNSSSAVNFTYGFQFQVCTDSTHPEDHMLIYEQMSPNSAIWAPLFHLDNITSVGLQVILQIFCRSTLTHLPQSSQSKITPLTYKSTSEDASFTFDLAFRPAFSFTAKVLDHDALSASVFADVPMISVNVSQAHNAQRNCLPAGIATPQDKIFPKLTHVVPTLSFDWGWNISHVGDDTESLGNRTAMATSCLGYSPKQSALGPVPNTPFSKESSASILAPWTKCFGIMLAVMVIVLCY